MIVICVTVGLQDTASAGKQSGTQGKKLWCFTLLCTFVWTVISWKWIRPDFWKYLCAFYFRLLCPLLLSEVWGIFFCLAFGGKWFVLVVCHPGAAGTCRMLTQRFPSRLLLTQNQRQLTVRWDVCWHVYVQDWCHFLLLLVAVGIMCFRCATICWLIDQLIGGEKKE